MSLEFDLIDQFFKPLCSPMQKGDVGIGDDGAVLSAPENHQLVVVTDTLIKGVHFPVDTSAYDIGWKALAVNLSDLAAMGATPAFYSLALTLPEHDAEWLSQFAEGMSALASQYHIPLIGGDTTKGVLTLTVTAQGWVPVQQAVLRSGAQVGDVICVTGCIGDAALGLKLALGTLHAAFKESLSVTEQQALLQALNRPSPQLSMADALRQYAHSAIDISDGLLADLGHVLTKSGRSRALPLGADIELSALPVSDVMQRYISENRDWALPLTGGDDYQLCLTVSAENYPLLQAACSVLDVSLTAIGSVVEQSTVRCLFEDEEVDFSAAEGYSHF